MKIIVKIKNVYGNKTIYPVCDTAKIFASISGNKTLIPPVIEKIKQLGYTVEVEQVTL